MISLTAIIAASALGQLVLSQTPVQVSYYPFGPDGQEVQVYGYPTAGNLDIFYQIPFAQPRKWYQSAALTKCQAVGPLRFKPPQPLTTVPAIINETTYSKGCMQGPVFGQSFFDEDCLYLNVWRPQGYNETSNLPVLVWL